MVFNAAVTSSKITGSSMVAGIVQSVPSAIFATVPRNTLPERVFGNLSTTTIDDPVILDEITAALKTIGYAGS